MSTSENHEQLSRRCFFLAAGAAAALLSGGAGEAAGAAELGGRWKVKIQWPERTLSDVLWTIDDNGTFTSSDGFNGIWTQRGSLVLLTVHGGNKPSYAGTVSDQSIKGVALQPNGRKGFWTADLQP